MAGAARRPGAGPAAVVGARRSPGQLEQLGLAMEPVADGRQGLRGAAARPGAVDRLRTRLHPARLGSLGRAAVRRFDGGDRRGVRTSAHRRDPDRGDGRLVRRIHGQLDRRSHQPFRRDRDPRQPVGAGPIRADNRYGLLLAPGDDAGDDRRQLAAPFRRQHRHADAGHSRRQGLSRADRRGPAALVRAAGLLGAAGRRRRQQSAPLPVFPVRGPLGRSRRNTPRSGTRWCSPSWPSMCWGRAPNGRRRSEYRRARDCNARIRHRLVWGNRLRGQVDRRIPGPGRRQRADRAGRPLDRSTAGDPRHAGGIGAVLARF